MHFTDGRTHGPVGLTDGGADIIRLACAARSPEALSVLLRRLAAAATAAGDRDSLARELTRAGALRTATSWAREEQARMLTDEGVDSGRE